MSNHPELLVVMPVYNEESSIDTVVREWVLELNKYCPNSVMLIINDGSTDRTQDILDKLVRELGARIETIQRENRGHGRTCIEGYRNAIQRGIPYILQIDSDGQSSPEHFNDFWRARIPDGVIYGRRIRSDGYRRVLASLILRLALRLFAKVDCLDANVPYRLMSSRACAEAIFRIPASINLANIALAVVLRRDVNIRHHSIPISFPPRIGGEPSVPFSKFATRAVELFIQLRGLNREPGN